MAARAALPLAASPTTSISEYAARRRFNSSRARRSSSTTNTFILVGCGRDFQREPETGGGTVVAIGLEGQLGGAVEVKSEAGAKVLQPDACGAVAEGQATRSVRHLYQQLAAFGCAFDANQSAIDVGADTVLDGVLDECLHGESRHQCFLALGGNFKSAAEPIFKSDLFESEIILNG